MPKSKSQARATSQRPVTVVHDRFVRYAERDEPGAWQRVTAGQPASDAIGESVFAWGVAEDEAGTRWAVFPSHAEALAHARRAG